MKCGVCIMPDITMCIGEDCEVKNTCYRFTANPNKYQQSYFDITPFIVNNCRQVCEYYWPTDAEEA